MNAKAKPNASAKANATKKKEKAGILPNVFKMPLSDTTSVTDAALRRYLIDRENTPTGWLSDDSTNKEQRMMTNIVSSAENANRLGTNVTLSREEHELYLARINAEESIHLELLGLDNTPKIDASRHTWSLYAQGQREKRNNRSENNAVDDDIDNAMALILTDTNPELKEMSNDDHNELGMENNNSRKYLDNK
jgi:hypothetical protein